LITRRWGFVHWSPFDRFNQKRQAVLKTILVYKFLGFSWKKLIGA
jgi:hypothetical protein